MGIVCRHRKTKAFRYGVGKGESITTTTKAKTKTRSITTKAHNSILRRISNG